VSSLGLSQEVTEEHIKKLNTTELKIDLIPFLSIDDLKEAGVSDDAVLEAMTKSIEELRKIVPSKPEKVEEKEEKQGWDSVYVRDIDPLISDEDFIKVFNSVGQVTTVKRFPEHRYAFVCYVDHKGAEDAVKKLNGTPLGKLVVKVQVIEPTNSLWVGNVVNCPEHELKAAFDKFGIVVRTNVLSAKQCAFVTYATAKEAAAARHALEGVKLGDIPVTINFKINKKERTGTRRGRDDRDDRDDRRDRRGGRRRDDRDDRDRPRKRRRSYDRYDRGYDRGYDYDDYDDYASYDSYAPYSGGPPPPYDSYGGPGYPPRRRPPPPPPRRRSDGRPPRGGRGGRGKRLGGP